MTTGVPGTPRILVVSASIGAGHDGVATELARRAREAGVRRRGRRLPGAPAAGVGAVLRSAHRWQLRLAPATWGWVLALLDPGRVAITFDGGPDPGKRCRPDGGRRTAS